MTSPSDAPVVTEKMVDAAYDAHPAGRRRGKR